MAQITKGWRTTFRGSDIPQTFKFGMNVQFQFQTVHE